MSNTDRYCTRAQSVEAAECTAGQQGSLAKHELQGRSWQVAPDNGGGRAGRGLVAGW